MTINSGKFDWNVTESQVHHTFNLQIRKTPIQLYLNDHHLSLYKKILQINMVYDSTITINKQEPPSDMSKLQNSSYFSSIAFRYLTSKCNVRLLHVFHVNNNMYKEYYYFNCTSVHIKQKKYFSFYIAWLFFYKKNLKLKIVKRKNVARNSSFFPC